jgi:hemolysin activation/secretion protein
VSRALAAAAAATALALAPAARAQSPGDFLPAAPAAGATAAAPETPPPPAPLAAGRADGPTLTLRAVRLDGATALGAAELRPLWAELLGTEVSLATLEAIAESVGAAYRARGFVLSQAFLPPQTVEDGVVVVQVVEGFIDRVSVAGGAPSQARAAGVLFAPVPADRPLRIETLERAVLLSRDIFGAGVGTVLEPSPDRFGAADLTVAIATAPVTGFASADNRGSRLYGEWAFVTGATAFNRLGLNEQIGVVGAGAFDGSLGYVQGTFQLPILGLAGTRLDGATLTLAADYANGEPDLARAGAPDAQTLTTNETNLRAGLVVPFIRTRAQNLIGEIALDWQDAENVTGVGAAETTEDDRLLVLEARLAWDRADRFGGVTLVEAGLRQGLDASDTFIGGGPASGVADFTLATLDVARLQRLGQSPWSLWLEAIGQFAWDVLPNSQRFALGDATIGRGFAPGNTTGDSGYGGRIELRRAVEGAALGGAIEAAELYAYGDYGQAYDRDGDRDGERWEPLGSAGFGARLDVRPWLTVTPEVARQLDGRPTDTRDPDRETRLYIGAVARF